MPVRGSLLTGISTPSDGGQLADQLEPVDVGLGPAQPEQHPAQVVAERDRRIGRGVDAAGRGHVVPPGGDAVGGGDGGLQAGAARLLDVEGRGVGRQRAAEHAFAHQVEIAAVLEHRAADHGAELLAGQIEAVDQPAQRGGEHVLVGGVGVRAVRARERDAVAAEDGDSPARVCWPWGPSYPPFLLWSKFVSWLPTCTRNSSIRRRETSSPSSSASRSPRRCAATGQAIRRWRARCSSAVRAASSNRCAARWPRTTTWCPTTSAAAGPTRSAGWCSTPPASPSPPG